MQTTLKMAVPHFVGVLMLISLASGGLVHEMKIHGKDPGFSWKGCMPDEDALMYVKDLQIGPDPIQFGQDVTVSATVVVKDDIGKDASKTVDVDYSVTISMGGEPMDVCQIAPEYCQLKDVCKLIKTEECPPSFEHLGIKCQCPLPKNTYQVSEAKIPLPKESVPFGGPVSATMKVTQAGQQIGCVNIKFCLGECNGMM